MTYICSPLSAESHTRMLENAALASLYMQKAREEFGDRAIAPHAVLPTIVDDSIPEERALALEFGMKLLRRCTRVAVYGPRISSGMKGEIEEAKRLGIPVIYRMDQNAEG